MSDAHRPLNSTLARAAALALACAACAPPSAEQRRAVVFASASLATPLAEAVESFARSHPEARIDLHTAGTPQLVAQVRGGVRVDLFAAADARSLEPIEGHFGPSEPLALNGLSIAVAAGNPRRIAGLADLDREDLVVALCGPAVPAGRYAREALARAGIEVRSVSDEPSVRALVAKIAMGEVDAGVVYRTDLHGRGDTVEGIALPPSLDVSVPLVLALHADDPSPSAVAFGTFLASSEARAILRRHGFEVRP